MHRSLSSLVLVACGGAAPAAPPAPRPVRCDGPVVIASQDDLAAVAPCTSLPGVTIRTGGALDLTALHAAAITGDLSIGPSAGLDTVSLPALATLGGTLHIANNGMLVGVFLPHLAQAGRVEVDNNAALTTLSLPALTTAAALVITDNASLEVVDVGQLATVGEMVLTNAPRLTVFEHPAGLREPERGK